MCISAGTLARRQGEVEIHAVLGGHAGILVGVYQERRRRFGRDLFLVGEVLDQVRGRLRAQQVSARAGVAERLGE